MEDSATAGACRIAPFTRTDASDATKAHAPPHTHFHTATEVPHSGGCVVVFGGELLTALNSDGGQQNSASGKHGTHFAPAQGLWALRPRPTHAVVAAPPNLQEAPGTSACGTPAATAPPSNEMDWVRGEWLWQPFQQNAATAPTHIGIYGAPEKRQTVGERNAERRRQSSLSLRSGAPLDTAKGRKTAEPPTTAANERDAAVLALLALPCARSGHSLVARGAPASDVEGLVPHDVTGRGPKASAIASMRRPFPEHPAAALTASELWLFGGRTAGGKLLCDLWCIDGNAAGVAAAPSSDPQHNDDGTRPQAKRPAQVPVVRVWTGAAGVATAPTHSAAGGSAFCTAAEAAVVGTRSAHAAAAHHKSKQEPPTGRKSGRSRSPRGAESRKHAPLTKPEKDKPPATNDEGASASHLFGPAPRYGHSSVWLPAPADSLLIFGGTTEFVQCAADMWAFAPRLGRWRMVDLLASPTHSDMERRMQATASAARWYTLRCERIAREERRPPPWARSISPTSTAAPAAVVTAPAAVSAVGVTFIADPAERSERPPKSAGGISAWTPPTSPPHNAATYPPLPVEAGTVNGAAIGAHATAGNDDDDRLKEVSFLGASEGWVFNATDKGDPRDPSHAGVCEGVALLCPNPDPAALYENKPSTPEVEDADVDAAAAAPVPFRIVLVGGANRWHLQTAQAAHRHNTTHAKSMTTLDRRRELVGFGSSFTSAPPTEEELRRDKARSKFLEGSPAFFTRTAGKVTKNESQSVLVWSMAAAPLIAAIARATDEALALRAELAVAAAAEAAKDNGKRKGSADDQALAFLDSAPEIGIDGPSPTAADRRRQSSLYLLPAVAAAAPAKHQRLVTQCVDHLFSATPFPLRSAEALSAQHRAPVAALKALGSQVTWRLVSDGQRSHRAPAARRAMGACFVPHVPRPIPGINRSVGSSPADVAVAGQHVIIAGGRRADTCSQWARHLPAALDDAWVLDLKAAYRAQSIDEMGRKFHIWRRVAELSSTRADIVESGNSTALLKATPQGHQLSNAQTTVGSLDVAALAQCPTLAPSNAKSPAVSAGGLSVEQEAVVALIRAAKRQEGGHAEHDGSLHTPGLSVSLNSSIGVDRQMHSNATQRPVPAPLHASQLARPLTASWAGSHVTGLSPTTTATHGEHHSESTPPAAALTASLAPAAAASGPHASSEAVSMPRQLSIGQTLVPVPTHTELSYSEDGTGAEVLRYVRRHSAHTPPQEHRERVTDTSAHHGKGGGDSEVQCSFMFGPLMLPQGPGHAALMLNLGEVGSPLTVGAHTEGVSIAGDEVEVENPHDPVSDSVQLERDTAPLAQRTLSGGASSLRSLQRLAQRAPTQIAARVERFPLRHSSQPFGDATPSLSPPPGHGRQGSVFQSDVMSSVPSEPSDRTPSPPKQRDVRLISVEEERSATSDSVVGLADQYGPSSAVRFVEEDASGPGDDTSRTSGGITGTVASPEDEFVAAVNAALPPLPPDATLSSTQRRREHGVVRSCRPLAAQMLPLRTTGSATDLTPCDKTAEAFAFGDPDALRPASASSAHTMWQRIAHQKHSIVAVSSNDTSRVPFLSEDSSRIVEDDGVWVTSVLGSPADDRAATSDAPDVGSTVPPTPADGPVTSCVASNPSHAAVRFADVDADDGQPTPPSTSAGTPSGLDRRAVSLKDLSRHRSSFGRCGSVVGLRPGSATLQHRIDSEWRRRRTELPPMASGSMSAGLGRLGGGARGSVASALGTGVWVSVQDTVVSVPAHDTSTDHPDGVPGGEAAVGEAETCGTAAVGDDSEFTLHSRPQSAQSGGRPSSGGVRFCVPNDGTTQPRDDSATPPRGRAASSVVSSSSRPASAGALSRVPSAVPVHGAWRGPADTPPPAMEREVGGTLPGEVAVTGGQRKNVLPTVEWSGRRSTWVRKPYVM